MADASLSMTYADLQRGLSRFLGYDNDALSADQTTEVDDYIRAGYRRLLYPRPTQPGDSPHQWSFMSPATTLTLSATRTSTATGAYEADVSEKTTITAAASIFVPWHEGRTITVTLDEDTDYTMETYVSATVVYVDGDVSWSGSKAVSIEHEGVYDAPTDFGSFIGRPTYQTSGTGIQYVNIVPEQRIRELRVLNTSSGYVRMIAVRPKSSANTANQTHEFLVWPYPTEDKVLDYRYKIRPYELDGTTRKYPLGGEQFGELLKECVLAEAEIGANDEIGIHGRRADELLAAAVGEDLQMQPKTLGYNRDGSDDAYYGGGARTVTYNGVAYTREID